jgi:hypothetical protein
MEKSKMKMEMLEMLKQEMKEMMGEEKKGMLSENMPKKVTVMSDSKEGLEKGLSKAQQIMKAKLGSLPEEEEYEKEDEMEEMCEKCEESPCCCE